MARQCILYSLTHTTYWMKLHWRRKQTMTADADAYSRKCDFETTILKWTPGRKIKRPVSVASVLGHCVYCHMFNPEDLGRWCRWGGREAWSAPSVANPHVYFFPTYTEFIDVQAASHASRGATAVLPIRQGGHAWEGAAGVSRGWGCGSGCEGGARWSLRRPGPVTRIRVSGLVPTPEWGGGVSESTGPLQWTPLND